MRHLTLAAALLAPMVATAQDLPGDSSAGLVLARKICVECHYVEKQWADLYVYEAPSFVDIANHSDHSEMSLQVFFRSPHNRMPNIKLTSDEIDDVISYILGLREPK
jgi:mono/diheme cytochrome c family protein